MCLPVCAAWNMPRCRPVPQSMDFPVQGWSHSYASEYHSTPGRLQACRKSPTANRPSDIAPGQRVSSWSTRKRCGKGCRGWENLLLCPARLAEPGDGIEDLSGQGGGFSLGRGISSRLIPGFPGRPRFSPKALNVFSLPRRSKHPFVLFHEYHTSPEVDRVGARPEHLPSR